MEGQGRPSTSIDVHRRPWPSTDVLRSPWTSLTSTSHPEAKMEKPETDALKELPLQEPNAESEAVSFGPQTLC